MLLRFECDKMLDSDSDYLSAKVMKILDSESRRKMRDEKQWRNTADVNRDRV